jgi:hypothetical protein
MFNFPPANLYTTYKGSTYRSLSPRIWSRIFGAAMPPDGSDQLYLTGSDFRLFGKTTAVAANVGRYNDGHCQYLSYEDTGDTIAQIETDRNGAIKFTTAATDNNEDWLQPGDTKSVSAIVSSTAADKKLLAFECRFKIGQLAETAVFIGLSEEGLAGANTLVDDTGALASKDMIGFHIPTHASVATCSFVFRKAGQTAVTLISGLKTMVADTYYNMGFVFDPLADNSKRLIVYLDNAEQSTYGTNTQLTAATFPDGEELQPLFGFKTGEAGAKTLTIDSWALAQLG